MAIAAPARASDAQLADIRMRLVRGLNDEGLRAWYSNDVATLLSEVMALRQLMAKAVEVCRSNPALHSDTNDLLTAVKEISERWHELQSNAWQRNEFKRFKARLEAEVDAAKERANKAEVAEGNLTVALGAERDQNAALRAQVDQLEASLVDAVADAQRALSAAQESATRVKQASELLAQALEAVAA